CRAGSAGDRRPRADAGTESGGRETVPPQLVVLGMGRLRREQRLQRLDVPYRNGAEPLGRDRSGSAPESASRRGDQPGRLLRRPRDAAGGGGEQRSRRVDAGGAPQRTVWQLGG